MSNHMTVETTALTLSDTESSLLASATEIVAAYVANNPVPALELPALILSVHASLVALAAGTLPGAAPAEPEVEKPTPGQIRKSVTPDALISFIDGKPYKTLKRHLTGHGLDPVTYRTKYGLPADYPVVAANYAAQRSALAKAIGLGVPGARKGSADPEVANADAKPSRRSKAAA